MDTIIRDSAVFKLFFVFAAACAWWLTVRLVRRSQGWPWDEVVAQLKAGNIAVAIYSGALLIALAVLMGLAVG